MFYNGCVQPKLRELMNKLNKKTMDIKQKYLEEKEIDCYVQQWQKEKPSYTDDYVEWLEQEQLRLYGVIKRLKK